MGKGKKGVKDYLEDKKRLRAKELLISEEYLSDLEAYEKVKSALDNINLDTLDNSQKLHKLCDEVFKQRDFITSKYGIPRPYSRTFLESVARGLNVEMNNFNYRGHRVVRQILLGNDMGVAKSKIIHRGTRTEISFLATTPNNRLILEIDPKANRKDIHFQIEEILDLCVEFNIKKNNQRFRDTRIRDFEVYRLRCVGKTVEFPVLDRSGRATGERRMTDKKRAFGEIGAELGMKEEAARKSFNVAYKLIHGEPYRKGVKVKVRKAFLKKECGTCADNPQAGTFKKDRPPCKRLCPEVLAYANQDKG